MFDCGFVENAFCIHGIFVLLQYLKLPLVKSVAILPVRYPVLIIKLWQIHSGAAEYI